MHNRDEASVPDLTVSIKDLGKVFGTGGGVQGVHLDIYPAEILGICGESGCGKSTLLRMLAGILEPDTGTMTMTGDPRRAMVFQEPRLLPWLSAEDNVALVLREPDPDAVRAILAEVGLANAARLRPRQLSGGMRQRVGIARALVARPNLLLMDEPLANLDYFTRLELLSLLQRELDKHRVTAVFVSHDVRELARLCDRVLVLGGHPGTVSGVLINPLDRAQRAVVVEAVARFEEAILDVIGIDHGIAGGRAGWHGGQRHTTVSAGR